MSQLNLCAMLIIILAALATLTGCGSSGGLARVMDDLAVAAGGQRQCRGNNTPQYEETENYALVIQAPCNVIEAKLTSKTSYGIRCEFFQNGAVSGYAYADADSASDWVTVGSVTRASFANKCKKWEREPWLFADRGKHEIIVEMRRGTHQYLIKNTQAYPQFCAIAEEGEQYDADYEWIEAGEFGTPVKPKRKFSSYCRLSEP